MIGDKKLLLNLDNVVARRPITADIFLTDYCNNRCPYCTYARYGERNGRYMRFNDFVRYSERLLDFRVRGMILTGGGEPTINPDFMRICEYLEDSNIPYGINTNFNQYREIHPTYLKVSLDAWDEDSYQDKRGVRAYERTRENILRYADAKGETSLGIQLTVCEPNEILPFYDANRDLPVDYIVFRPIESTRGEYYANRDIYGEMSVLHDLAKLDSRVTVNYKWDKLNMSFDRCYAHDLQIALDTDGNVIYCCHKPYEIVGHVMDSDILDKCRSAVTDMSRCDIPCRLTAPNEIIRVIETDKSRDRGFI